MNVLELLLEQAYALEVGHGEGLPKIAQRTSDDELGHAILSHHRVSQNQVGRLEEAFGFLQLQPRSGDSFVLDAIMARLGSQLQELDNAGSGKDLLLVSTLSQLEAIELDLYSSLQQVASQLGLDEVSSLLQRSSEEENAFKEEVSSHQQRLIQELGP